MLGSLVFCVSFLAAIPRPWTPVQVSDGKVSVWGRHHEDWLAHAEDGRPITYWYRMPAQRDYRSCLASCLRG